MLTKKQIEDVCLVGQEAKTCRYLSENNNNFFCLKKSSKKQIIDIEVKEFFSFCEKKNVDPKKFYLPIGDNCSGYHFLKNVQQGYDVKD